MRQDVPGNTCPAALERLRLRAAVNGALIFPGHDALGMNGGPVRPLAAFQDREMDIATGIGIVFGFGTFIFLMMDGGGLQMFVSEHASIVIFGGSICATMIRFPFSTIMHGVPTAMKYAFWKRRFSQRE